MEAELQITPGKPPVRKPRETRRVHEPDLDLLKPVTELPLVTELPAVEPEEIDPKEESREVRRKLFRYVPELFSDEPAVARVAEAALVGESVVIRRHTETHPYKLERLLSKGGFGAVFVARHEKYGKVVVKFVKPFVRDDVISPKIAGDKINEAAHARSVLNEVVCERLLSNNKNGEPMQRAGNNPPVPILYDASLLPNPDRVQGEPDVRLAAIASEYIPGDTLSAFIKINPDLKSQPEEIESIVLQLMDAVKAIHNKGVIHFDLKPANIMITPDNQVIILDLGSAYLKEGKQEWTKHLTYTFTERYARREELGSYSETRDVFALGNIIYDLIYGRKSTPELRAAAYPALPLKLQTMSKLADSMTHPEIVQRADLGDSAELNDLVNKFFQ
ncbi:MAG: protein kinase [Patescibacteria group bacterium]|jgi:serine/threonine protein kinase